MYRTWSLLSYLVLEVVRIKNFLSLKFTKFSNRFWKLKILDRVCLFRTNFGGTKLPDLKWLMWSRIFGYKDHLRISSISRTNFPTSTISGLYLVIHLKITCSFVVCDSSSCYIQLDIHAHCFWRSINCVSYFTLYPLVLYQKTICIMQNVHIYI
jgi:hypothetical protein